jgi:hypothetical protein
MWYAYERKQATKGHTMPSISKRTKNALAGRVQVMITTAAFRSGQAAARRDFAVDPDATPNVHILGMLKSREFAAGYVDEWNNFLVPERVR